MEQVIIQGMTVPEFVNSLRTIIREELKAQQPEAVPEVSDRITKAEAMKLLGIKSSQVFNQRRKKFKIAPCTNGGRKLYFYKKDIESLFKKNDYSK